MVNIKWSDKIVKGMKKAADKFLKERATNDGVVIISDVDGVIKKVPAREILEKRRQEKG